MRKHSAFNKDYVDLNEAEVNSDRAIEKLTEVVARNPNNDEARVTLRQMKAARARFLAIRESFLE